MLTDSICPVPPEVARRAWECALDIGQEHSSFIGSPAVWHMLQAVVTQRDPEELTWAECAMLFRLHREFRPARA